MGQDSFFAFKEPTYADHVNAFTYPPLAAYVHGFCIRLLRPESGWCRDTEDHGMDGHACVAAICTYDLGHWGRCVMRPIGATQLRIFSLVLQPAPTLRALPHPLVGQSSQSTLTMVSKHTNKQPTVDYLINTIGLDWAVKASGWTKHLGYGLGLSSCGCFCSIDCLPVIEALYQCHMGAHNTYKPKHPYPMNINELKPGVRPPIDSRERAPFDEMQAKCQNGLATSIWISRAHTLHVYPTNYLCGMMSNPSYEVYKCWQHSLIWPNVLRHAHLC